MSLRLHILALASAAQSANLCFGEDFAVVAGQTAAGDLVLPACLDTQYLVAGGIPGLPYLPALGHEGARLDFTFPQPVLAILVATTSTQKPIPAAVYTAPVPPIAIVASGGTYRVSEQGNGTRMVYYYFAWSGPAAGLSTQYTYLVTNPAPAPAVPVGLTAEQLAAAGFSPLLAEE